MKKCYAFLLIIITLFNCFGINVASGAQKEYVYLKKTFNNLSYCTTAAKGNTIAIDNSSVLFERASGNTNDFHLDINNFSYETESIVYEFDVYLENKTSSFVFCFKDADGNFFDAVNLSGTTVYASADSSLKADISTGQWNRISVVFDTVGKKYSLYVNGSRVSYKKYFVITVTTADISNVSVFKKPQLARFHAKGDTSATANKFRIDNYHIYSGDSYRNVDGEDISVVINESVSSWSDDSTQSIYERPDRETVLADYNASPLKGVHPRLLATEEDFENINNLAKSDLQMKKWKDSLISQSEIYLASECLKYELRDGVRLWFVSMDFIERISHLALAYRLTGDERYCNKAKEEMKAIASFDYWHPEHHIDVGGLAVGFAIGYDWLYDTFSDEEKEFFEKSVYEKAFYDYNLLYQSESNSMGGALYGNNHNAVMNAGAVLLGVAFVDVYPELCAYFISNALRCNEKMLSKIGSEGSWYEGLGYAAMTVEYEVYLLASLDKVFSKVYSLDLAPGLDKLAEYFIYMQTNGGQFGFSDNSSTGNVYDSGVLWLMNHYGNFNAYSEFENLFADYADANCTVRNLLWYNPTESGDADFSRDKYYASDAVITTRESFDTPNGTFVGIKGGSPTLEHAHMDMGTFAYFDNGVEWTYDLGSGNYNAPGYWDTANLRWQYYPLRAEAHNCLVVNPDSAPEYSLSGDRAEFKEYVSDERMIAVLDMTKLQKDATDAKRGYFYTDNRKSLVVRDEIVLSKDSSSVYWFMQTAQNVAVDNKNRRIILTSKKDNSKKLYIDFCSSSDFELSASKSAPLPTSPNPSYNASYDSITRIMLKIPSCSGSISITAKLTPSYIKATEVSDYDVPIADWSRLDIGFSDNGDVKGESLYATDFGNNSFRKSGSYSYLTLGGVDEKVKDGGKIELRSYASCTTENLDGSIANSDGMGLKLKSSTSSQIRIETGAKGTGVLTFEFDYAKSTDNVSTNAIDGYFTNHKGNVNQHGGSVCFNAEGRIIVLGEDVLPYSANTMYKIRYEVDFSEQTVSIYINDEFCKSSKMAHGGCREWYRIALAVASSSVEQYIDNLGIYQYGHKNMISETNHSVENGILTISPGVISDGSVSKAKIIIAVYDETGKIADVESENITLSESVVKYRTRVNEFEFPKGYSWKVFFWDENMIKPLSGFASGQN